MPTEFYPLQVLLITLSGFVNRYQADVIAYLAEENRVLKEQMGGFRLRLSDDQRRRLSAKGKLIGRQALNPWYPKSQPRSIAHNYGHIRAAIMARCRLTSILSKFSC